METPRAGSPTRKSIDRSNERMHNNYNSIRIVSIILYQHGLGFVEVLNYSTLNREERRKRRLVLHALFVLRINVILEVEEETTQDSLLQSRHETGKKSHEFNSSSIS